ncbi:MAG: FAD-dependent oxidoreductase [Ginsengibacter sp.]
MHSYSKQINIGNSYFDELIIFCPFSYLPANKNIGTTHITNGCYRLHPVEWSIGEAVGMLISFSQKQKVAPHKIREKPDLPGEYQKFYPFAGIRNSLAKGR